MAEAAAAAAARAEDGVVARLVDARDARVEDVLAADGYVFATPENLATMAGMMKEFFDRTYYPVLDRIAGRPYAVLICAGSDGTGAARQIDRIAKGWRLRMIADPVIILTHAQAPKEILAPKRIAAADLDRCRVVGQSLAAGLALGIY
jgi:multimeric flavodoxin WrbA